MVDMPLSRTRSLLANINTSASGASVASVSDNTNSYQSHFSDTQEICSTVRRKYFISFSKETYKPTAAASTKWTVLVQNFVKHYDSDF